MLINKKTIYIFSSITIIIIWIVISLYLRDNKYFVYSKIAFTFIVFLIISYLAIKTIIPRTLTNLRLYLVIWILIKIITGVLYFNSLYVNRNDNKTSIVEYGDSFTHHNVATSYFNTWKQGQFLSNPIEISSQVDQWGYDYFLGVIYFITGPLPEIAIIINCFLALIFCLLSFKLFTYTDASQLEVTKGVILLSLMPMLWLLSSQIYKDTLLFTLIFLGVILIIKLIKQFKPITFLSFLLSMIAIFLIRYSYFFVIIVFAVLANFFLSKKPIRNFTIIITVLFILIFLVENSNLFDFRNLFDVMDYVQKSQSLDAEGGKFMTQSSGMITKTNFLYSIPTKSLYLIMIPFPWFQGATTIEFIDQTVQNLDSLFSLTVLFLVLVSIFKRKLHPFNRFKLILFTLALILYFIPLFMYFPSRRYITIAIPIFIAFSLHTVQNKKYIYKGISFSLCFIVFLHIAYYINTFI